MTEHVVQVPQQTKLGLVVLRAVPCDRHGTYVAACPDCLTGEQAQRMGVSQTTDDLGVVADSTWKRWSPERLRAAWRTRQVNRRIRNG